MPGLDKEIDVIAPVRLLNVTSARALNPMLLGLSLNNSTLLTIGESKRFCIRSSSGESPLTIEKVTILLAGESTESTFKTRLRYGLSLGESSPSCVPKTVILSFTL